MSLMRPTPDFEARKIRYGVLHLPSSLMERAQPKTEANEVDLLRRVRVPICPVCHSPQEFYRRL